MVEGTSFMGLGGANLVKGATGQTIDNETLGGMRAFLTGRLKIQGNRDLARKLNDLFP